MSFNADKFNEYTERMLKVNPKFTLRDAYYWMRESGKVIDSFINERIGKSQLVKWVRYSESKIHYPERSYFLNTADDLYQALLEYTADEQYSYEQMLHESEHDSQFRQFVSSSGQRINSVRFSVSIYSDGNILPFAGPQINTLFGCKELHDVFDERSLREYFLYLRECVRNDASTGDRLILSI